MNLQDSLHSYQRVQALAEVVHRHGATIYNLTAAIDCDWRGVQEGATA